MGSNFDNRPFQDIEEMHEGIRKRWNQEVAPEDDVYVLGDLIWNLRNSNREATKELLDSLNGKLHLILGNHDRTADPLFDECFEEVTPYKRLTELLDEQKRTVILSHYYMPFYEHHMHGAILLHGHSHRSREADLERKITAELQASNSEKDKTISENSKIISEKDKEIARLNELVASLSKNNSRSANS